MCRSGLQLDQQKIAFLFCFFFWNIINSYRCSFVKIKSILHKVLICICYHIDVMHKYVRVCITFERVNN